MADAVVDHLEAIQVEEQHGEATALVAVQPRERLFQRGMEAGPVRQAGQRIVQGIVDQLLFGVFAYLDLVAQFADRTGEFAGAVFDPAFQLGLQFLALERGHDVLRHVGEQGAVLRAVVHAGFIGLHDHRAARAAVAADRHPEEVQRGRAQADAADVQRLRYLACGAANRLAMPDQPQGQAVAQVGGRDLAIGFVDVDVLGIGEIDEAHAVAFAVVQGDEEVARVHQFADHQVDAPQHVFHAQFAAGEVGDAVQRRLQRFAALAFADLLGEGEGAFLHPAFEFVVRLASGQRDQDVVGDELQQGAVFLAETVGLVVALHHHRAADHAIGDHRHAEPVGAAGPVALRVLVEAECAAQLSRGSHRRASRVDHAEGQAVADPRRRVFLLRVDRAQVLFVGVVDEAQAVARAVVQRDQEIARVHQRTDDVVDAPQGVLHVQPRRREVGHRVQRGLQACGLFQPLRGLPLVLQFQCGGHACREQGEEAAPVGPGGIEVAAIGRAIHRQQHCVRHVAKRERQCRAGLRTQAPGLGRQQRDGRGALQVCIAGGSRCCFDPQMAQAEARFRFLRGNGLDVFEAIAGEQRRYEITARPSSGAGSARIAPSPEMGARGHTPTKVRLSPSARQARRALSGGQADGRRCAGVSGGVDP